MNACFRGLSFVALAGLAATSWALDGGPTLTYLGRATVKIVSSKGFTLYVDPCAPGDYSAPADLVLVTHGHADHNDVGKVTLKPGAVVAAPKGAVSVEGARVVSEGSSFSVGEVSVRAVPAYNRNHPRGMGVGYLITVDGVTVYHAGDTNYVPEMDGLKAAKIDYALFPVDGFYNMGGAEAARCAEATGARHVAAIHSSPNGMYDEAKAAALKSPNAFSLKPGQTAKLLKADDAS